METRLGTVLPSLLPRTSLDASPVVPARLRIWSRALSPDAQYVDAGVCVQRICDHRAFYHRAWRGASFLPEYIGSAVFR